MEIKQARETTESLLSALANDNRLEPKTFNWLSKQVRDSLWRREHDLRVKPTIEWQVYRMRLLLDDLTARYKIDLNKIDKLKEK